MGGQRSDILVFLLDDATTDLTTSLAEFDASKAQCYLDRDRQGLLAVIEASFGTFAPFNKLVRGIFLTQTVATSIELPSRSSRQGESPSGIAPIHRFIAGLGGGLVLRPTRPARLKPKFGHRLLGEVDSPAPPSTSMPQALAYPASAAQAYPVSEEPAQAQAYPASAAQAYPVSEEPAQAQAYPASEAQAYPVREEPAQAQAYPASEGYPLSREWRATRATGRSCCPSASASGRREPPSQPERDRRPVAAGSALRWDGRGLGRARVSLAERAAAWAAD